MASFSIIKNFDVIKQALDRFCSASVLIVVDPFTLQPSKEAFGNSIIIAVSLAAHTTDDSVFLEHFLLHG
jgi:hypothetical protein